MSLLLAGMLAPWLPLDDPTEIDLPDRLLPPSPGHLLGTDHLGRDTFSRVVHGARMTLLAAAVTLALSMTIALTVGILSGYHGGWADTALMGVVDLLLAFPSLILALAVAGALGPGLFNVLLAAGAVWWVGHARIIRGVTLGARQMEYVTAARAAGAGNLRIILRHIAPNILGPIIVIASLDVGWIILGIAGLNFLGLGAQPPTPEWGGHAQRRPPAPANRAPPVAAAGGGHIHRGAGVQPAGGRASGPARSPHRAAGRLTGAAVISQRQIYAAWYSVNLGQAGIEALGDARGVAPRFVSRDGAFQGVGVGVSAFETGSAEHAEFDLSHPFGKLRTGLSQLACLGVW